jgi:hypothetical protein
MCWRARPWFSGNLTRFTDKKGGILRIRLTSSLGVAALAAPLGFAAPALASSVRFETGAGKHLRGAHTKSSPFMAGYESTAPSPTATSVTTTLVVPTVKNCGTTKKVIIPFVATDAGMTGAAVGLDIHCRNGKVIYFPIFNTGHSPNKAFAHARAHPGDTVVLSLRWNSTRLSLAVVDKTHPSVTRKLTAPGSTSSFSDAAIGDSIIGKDVPVPDFGKVTFTKSKINGHALGLAPGLTRVDLVNMSDVLQIKTGPIRSDNRSFTTTFKHS